MDKIYLLIGNDTPLAVCLRKSEGEETPVPYDLSEARHLRLTLVGHGMRVCAKDIEVSGDDNNVVSGMIPGRSLLKGDYDLEVTFTLDGRDKRFAIDNMFEAVDFLAEDADGEAEGEGAGIFVTVTVQPELIEISGPTGPQGKSAYQVWLDDGHTGTEDDFFEWLAAQTPNPDWNQNDSTKADFIKNRTHWEEESSTTINDAKLAWSGSTPETLDFWLYGTDVHIPRTSVGWGLTWEGGELFIDDNGLGYEIGVYNGEEWSINPFDPSYDQQPYPLNVDVVITSGTTVHKLDNKFLDLDSTPTLNSQKPVTSDGVKTFVEGKGYYTKPQSGIPASDIAAGVIPTVPTDIVKYTSQSLTDAQKTQARTNIGAASDSEVSQLRSEVADKPFSLNNSFIGNGNTYVQKNIQGLVPGRKYLFVLKSNEWDMSGVTQQNVYKFILVNRYNEQTTKTFAYAYTSGGTTTVKKTYILDIPSESDYIAVGGRATQGVEVFFNIYDITDIDALQTEFRADIDENKQSILSLEQSFSEKDEIIFKYPFLPGTAETRFFREVNFIAGRKYHYKIEPNGFIPASGSTYAISLRTCSEASTSGILENIVIVLTSEYSGQVIEGDFIPTQDAPYLYIYNGSSAEQGSGISYTLREIANEDKELQNSLSERMLETSIIPLQTATSAIFPAFKMYAGRSYQIDVEMNGYVVSSQSDSPITIRAMKTPYINGASDPNIVAVIISQLRYQANYAPGDFSIQYHAIADSEYIQLYCGRASVVGSGIQLRVRELCMTAKDSITSSRLAVSSDGVARALARIGNFTYSGRLLDLHTHKTTIAEALKLTSGNQGCDITNGYLFQAFDGGRCRVYDFGRRKPAELGNFMFACASADNHFNSINFGVETPAGCSFPAVYITTGKVDSPVEYVCHVEGITESNGVYTSALLQTITLDTSDWEANGYMRIFGCPVWFVDKERGYLWVFSAKLRTTQEATGEFKNNKYIATQFRLPAISEGNLVLDASDILRQVIFEFDTYFTQGGTMKDGKIYYCFGLGNATYPANVRVFDTDDGSVATRMNAVLTTEPEDMTEYDGELYLVNASGMVYQLT